MRPVDRRRKGYLSEPDRKHVEYQQSNNPNVGKYQTKPGTGDIRLSGYEANNNNLDTTRNGEYFKPICHSTPRKARLVVVVEQRKWWYTLSASGCCDVGRWNFEAACSEAKGVILPVRIPHLGVLYVLEIIREKDIEPANSKKKMQSVEFIYRLFEQQIYLLRQQQPSHSRRTAVLATVTLAAHSLVLFSEYPTVWWG